MGTITRSAVIALCVVALATLMGTGIGCGTSGETDETPQWEEVVSSEISGGKPVKVLLGTYPLGDRVRLAWDLSGPEKPPVMITLRVVEVAAGTGFGTSVSPQDPVFALHGDEALALGPIRPGDYRVYLSQRFPPPEGPGYDIKFTIFTTR